MKLGPDFWTTVVVPVSSLLGSQKIKGASPLQDEALYRPWICIKKSSFRDLNPPDFIEEMAREINGAYFFLAKKNGPSYITRHLEEFEFILERISGGGGFLKKNSCVWCGPWKSKDYFLNGFSVKTIVLVGIYNQQFKGTILFMVFDFQGEGWFPVDFPLKREIRATKKPPKNMLPKKIGILQKCNLGFFEPFQGGRVGNKDQYMEPPSPKSMLTLEVQDQTKNGF